MPELTEVVIIFTRLQILQAKQNAMTNRNRTVALTGENNTKDTQDDIATRSGRIWYLTYDRTHDWLQNPLAAYLQLLWREFWGAN